MGIENSNAVIPAYPTLLVLVLVCLAMTRRVLLFAILISLLAIFSQSQTTSGSPRVLIFSRTVE